MERVDKPKKFTTARNLRRSFRQGDEALRGQVAKLNVFEDNIRTAALRSDQIRLSSGNYFAEAYSDPPDLLILISQWVGYTVELNRARQAFDNIPPYIGQTTWDPTRAIIEKNATNNTLTFPINGTSLDDISSMPLPLSIPDISRIDLMIRRKAEGWLPSPGPDVQRTVNLVATQAELHPRAALSEPVRPLLQRLKNYWEYYTAWLLDPDPGLHSYQFMVKMAKGGDLPWGLATFIPARLHITPSSAYRLFDDRVENTESAAASIYKYVVRHGHFFSRLAAILNNTRHSPGALPTAIAKYQFTDPRSENRLTQELNLVYKGRTMGIQAESDPSLADGARATIKTLSSLYHKPLRDIVQNSPEGFLRIQTPEDSFFKEILVGTFYGKTLTIIGLTGNEQVFVTLDLLPSRHLFGIPAQLMRRDPNASYLLTQDLLGPVLREARARNPLVEYKPTSSCIAKPNVPKTDIVIPETTPKPPKRRILRTVSFIAGHQEMPKLSTEALPQEEKDNHLLIYKGQSVGDNDIVLLAAELADDLIANDQRLRGDVQLLIEELLKDPYGPGTYKIKDARPIVENDQKMPLRSFRGDNRRLPFKNRRYSDALRTVYCINPKTRSVILIGIMPHDKFNTIYASSSR